MLEIAGTDFSATKVKERSVSILPNWSNPFISFSSLPIISFIFLIEVLSKLVYTLLKNIILLNTLIVII